MKNAIISVLTAIVVFIITSVIFVSCSHAKTLEESIKENTNRVIKQQSCVDTAVNRGVLYGGTTGAVALGATGILAALTAPVSVPMSAVAGATFLYSASGFLIGGSASLATRISDNKFFDTNVLKQNCQIKYAKETGSKIVDSVSNMADAVGDIAKQAIKEAESKTRNLF